MDKSPDAFRTISEVAEALETPAHVLRFWETRFPQIRPVKRAGGRRYYRPSDLALLAGIKRLLHEEGLTIRGVQKILREQGVRYVAGLTDETSEEEAALISTMSARREPAEVTRLTPREADLASIRALEHEARLAGDDSVAASGGSEVPDAGPAAAPHKDGASGNPAPEGLSAASDLSAQVITFPVETPQDLVIDLFPQTAASTDNPPKDPSLPAADPRQTMFPGFGPAATDDDSLTEPLAPEPFVAEPFVAEPFAAEPGELAPRPTAGLRDFSESTHQDHHEEAPFAFDIDEEGDGAGTGATIAPFPPAAQGGEAAGAEPEEEAALPQKTIAARLRALPAGSLLSRKDEIRALSHRVRALRQRLEQAQHRPG